MAIVVMVHGSGGVATFSGSSTDAVTGKEWTDAVRDQLLAQGWVEVSPTRDPAPIIKAPQIIANDQYQIKPKAKGWHDVHDKQGRRKRIGR